MIHYKFNQFAIGMGLVKLEIHLLKIVIYWKINIFVNKVDVILIKKQRNVKNYNVNTEQLKIVMENILII
jgi:hypothetical protein